MSVVEVADYTDAELDGYEPTVVHVDTENRAVDPAVVTAATTDPRRYAEIEAQVSRELASIDAELADLGDEVL